MRSTNWAAACVATLLAVTGCATVPTSGPVDRHTPQPAGVNSGIHVDPLPPAPGASQLLVVEGFLHAMGVHQPDYAVARQYLTETASQNWRPESGVEVYTEKDQPVETEQGVALSATRVGSVDASGVYLPDNTDKRYTFELVKDQAGQWRIANPPPGLVVSRYLFSTNYTPASLHFLEASGQFLVPDPRFFASGDQAMAAVVRAQLGGSSPWLKPVVQQLDTAEISVTDLSVESDGLLSLTLGSEADALSTQQRHTLLAELAYTMTGFGRINSVRVNSGGQPWRAESGQIEVGPETFASLSPEHRAAPGVLFAVRDGKLQRMREPGSWNDLATVQTELRKPEQLALPADLSEVAGITGGGTRLEQAPIGAGKVKLLRTGTDLLRPDYSRNGELWSFAASGVAGTRVFRDGAPVPLDSSGMPAARLVAAQLSPDGARIALILQQGGRTEVGLAIVGRSPEGAITLSGWRGLDVAMSTGLAGKSLDLGWASPTQLAVLQTTPGGETSVIRISQDGASANDIGPSNSASLQQLAVVPASPPVALAYGGGAYRYESDFNWTLSITGVDVMAYPG